MSVVTASSYCQHNESASKLMTAPGVEYRMLLNGLSDPRGLVADAEGNLLVVERGDGGKGVTRVVLDDGHGTHVCVESKTRLVPDSKVRVCLLVGVENPLRFHQVCHSPLTPAQPRHRSLQGRQDALCIVVVGRLRLGVRRRQGQTWLQEAHHHGHEAGWTRHAHPPDPRAQPQPPPRLARF